MRFRITKLIAITLVLVTPFADAEPVTYQGVLQESGQPAQGAFDMRFTLFDSATGGSNRNTSSVPGVQVIDGLFSVEFNLNAGVLGDTPLWIEVAVSPAGAGSFTTLSPRQPLSWSPRALNTRGLSVEQDGDVGLGIENPEAKLHIAPGGDEPFLMQVNQTLFASDNGFVGVNRPTQLSAAEYFGIRSRTTGANYGGMYVETLSPIGLPFYGYAAFGQQLGWSYIDPSAEEWRLNLAGTDRVFVSTSTGNVGIYGAPTDTAHLSVIDESNTEPYNIRAFGGTEASIYGYTASPDATGGLFTGAGGAVALTASIIGSSSDIIVGRTGFLPANVRFRVTSTGDVRADGTFIGGGADFAEMLPASDHHLIEPGDVLSIAPDGSLIRSHGAYQTSVAGVCSTKPAFLGGAISDSGEDNDLSGQVPLAVVGIVPTKACMENGPITPGDLLVSSSTPGHAMRAGEDPPAGSVIGKALSPLTENEGVVRVLLMAR